MRRLLVVIGWLGCGGGTPNPGTVDGGEPPNDGEVTYDPLLPCPVSGPSGTVTVETEGQRTVVFHDERGAVLSRTNTDGNGIATGEIPPCGAITVQNQDDLLTVTHLQPGDTVSLLQPGFVQPGTQRTVTVDFPTVQGATSYSFNPGRRSDSLQSGCGLSTAQVSPATVAIDDRCIATDGTTSFTAIARDGGGQPLGYLSLTGVTVPGTASIPEWRTTMAATAVSFTNPQDATWDGAFSVVMFASELQIASPGLASANVPGSVAPGDVGNHALQRASLTNPLGAVGGVDQLQRMASPLAASLAIDGTDFAPHVATTTRDDADADRPLISWTTTRPTTGEHAIVTIAFYENDRWYVISPPNQPGAVRYPELPDDLQPNDPAPTATVMVVDTSLFDGYATARLQPLGLWSPMPYLPRTATTSFAHRISASGDFEEPDL